MFREKQLIFPFLHILAGLFFHVNNSQSLILLEKISINITLSYCMLRERTIGFVFSDILEACFSKLMNPLFCLTL